MLVDKHNLYYYNLWKMFGSLDSFLFMLLLTICLALFTYSYRHIFGVSIFLQRVQNRIVSYLSYLI